jgi:hypothetical protein
VAKIQSSKTSVWKFKNIPGLLYIQFTYAIKKKAQRRWFAWFKLL